MRIIELQYGNMSFCIWTKSYVCGILKKDVYTAIRPYFQRHGIQYIVQVTPGHVASSFTCYEGDIVLQRMCCMMSMRVGKTRDTIHLQEDEVYMVAWNIWYPSFLCWKCSEDVLTKIRKIYHQVQTEKMTHYDKVQTNLPSITICQSRVN